jgi:hypothetical protein
VVYCPSSENELESDDEDETSKLDVKDKLPYRNTPTLIYGSRDWTPVSNQLVSRHDIAARRVRDQVNHQTEAFRGSTISPLPRRPVKRYTLAKAMVLKHD